MVFLFILWFPLSLAAEFFVSELNVEVVLSLIKNVFFDTLLTSGQGTWTFFVWNLRVQIYCNISLYDDADKVKLFMVPVGEKCDVYINDTTLFM